MQAKKSNLEPNLDLLDKEDIQKLIDLFEVKQLKTTKNITERIEEKDKYSDEENFTL